MIDIKEYLMPEKGIMKELSRLEILYQIVNQDKIEVYLKKEQSENFSGTFGEYDAVREIRKLVGFSDRWSYLLRAIFLLENYNTEVDIGRYTKLSDKDTIILFENIKRGIKARDSINKWIEPIEKEGDNVLQAVKDAASTNVSEKFQVLKLGRVSKDTKEDRLTLFDQVMEIKNPDELIEFLKTSNIKDGLFLAVQKNEKYDFKGTFHIFLIYKGILYNIDNSEKRLNLDNTAGARNPQRYLERAYEGVWLPVNLILEDDEDPKNVPVEREKIFKIASMNDIKKKDIEVIYYLQVLMYKLVELINSNKKIELGITSMAALKQIEDKSGKSFDMKKEYGVGHYTKGSGEYLLNKYGKEVPTTALVPTKADLPDIIGTRRYIQEVISYKQRQLLAKEIEEDLIKDYNARAGEVREWISRFIEKQDFKRLVIEVLKDKKYGYRHYRGFASRGFKGKGNWRWRKRWIATIMDNDAVWFSSYGGRMNTVIIETKNLSGEVLDNTCKICQRTRKRWIKLGFIDYHQFIEFFEVDKSDLPDEMIEHLHQQSELYVGNSILDDVDPVDQIDDPWFTNKSLGIVRVSNNTAKELIIYIPICGRCLRKYKNISKKENSKNNNPK